MRGRSKICAFVSLHLEHLNPEQLAAVTLPDGYVLLVASVAQIAIAPAVQGVRYDPLRDFRPIALMNRFYQIVIVNPQVAAKTSWPCARPPGCFVSARNCANFASSALASASVWSGGRSAVRSMRALP